MTQVLDDLELRVPPAERLARRVARLAGRLEEYLATALPHHDKELAEGRAFLRAEAAAFADQVPDNSAAGTRKQDHPTPLDPLDRLTVGLGLSRAEVDLLLLAGLPEEHEGFGQILQELHPHKYPRPTVGLAAQLCCHDRRGRSWLRRLLETGPAVISGLLCLQGDGPFFRRNLVPAEAIWPALQGIDAWPEAIRPVGGPVGIHGLEIWLEQPSVRRAINALREYDPCTVLVTDDEEEVAFQRGAALVRAAGVASVRIILPAAPSAERERLIQIHSLARGVVPVLRLTHPEGPGPAAVPALEGYPASAVVCARSGAAALRGGRPLIGVSCPRLRPSSLEQMWRQTLPGLAEDAAVLAARYPIEPSSALHVAADLRHLALRERRMPELTDVGASVRTRAGASLSGGVTLLRPTADWNHLVLAPDRLALLREAVDRLMCQSQVLDQWGFLKGRRGARGVRMLFSGPPGTGKTLSAEVLAGALEVDLLIVDLSRVVSKWIGETEKNLAEVFQAAERARAALLFDEADALFGKRTDVSDAHDRYANLETAYLLARLERFEGLAILSTNLRQNIDSAFLRRLEFIVEFTPPDRQQRLALWHCHLPDQRLVADDANFSELAARYPVVGALIRNAAVAAAFMAAAEGSKITQVHFVRAVRREYDKSGKAFPGLPTGMSLPEKGRS